MGPLNVTDPAVHCPARRARTVCRAIGFLALSLSLMSAGCSEEKGASPGGDAAASGGGPRISASPNPVPAGSEKFGKTTISWDTGDGTAGDVYVSKDGAPEKLFAADRPKSSLEAPWIGKGEYEFRLYAGKEHKKVLATVKVTKSQR